MNRLIATILMFALAGLFVVNAQAQEFPKEFAYNIYVYGQLAGTNVISTSKKDGTVTFESRSQMKFGEYSHDLTCKTEFATSDMSLLAFSYEGTRGGQEESGALWVRGDSIVGDLVSNGTSFPSAKVVKGKIFVFENYIAEHQAVLFSQAASSTEPYIRFNMFFPSSFATASTLALVESEVEIDTATTPSVCKKFQVVMQSSEPFFGYFDTKRGLTIYMDFPAVSTEIFLASAFGENPRTKYAEPVTGQ